MSNESMKLLKNFLTINDFTNFNINNYENLKYDKSMKSFINENYLLIISNINKFPHEYKKRNRFVFYKLIIDYFCDHKNIDLKKYIEDFKNIVTIEKAHLLIKKILNNYPNEIKKIFNNQLIINYVMKYGSLPIVIICLDLINKDKNNILYCFQLITKNNDSRVYKYFLNNKEYLYLISNEICKNKNYTKNLIINFGNFNFFENPNIKSKHFLKKLKYYHDYLNLTPHIVNYVNCLGAESLIFIIPFYINKEMFLKMDEYTIYDIIDIFDENIDIKNDFIKNCDKYIKNDNIRNYLYLSLFNSLNDKIIYDKELIEKYFSLFEEGRIININIIDLIIKNAKNNELKINNICDLTYLLFLEKIEINSENFSKIKNLLIIKKFLCKIMKIKYKTNIFIKNFYQKTNKINDFTDKPPQHLYLKNCSDFINKNILIKPKADGYIMNSLKKNVYPENLIDSNYIKGEFIEELNLILVFDIMIDGLSFTDRYNYLRSIHPYTNNFNVIEKLKNFSDIINFNKKEDENLQNFLKENKGKTLWYPKVCYETNLSESDYKMLLDYKSKNKKFNNSTYKTDGFIIRYNNTEYKMKPLDEMTIDLYYNGENWIDREENILNDLIIKNNISIKGIYRCYPIINKNILFVPREKRFDKKRANPNKVVLEIYNNLEEYNENKYYQLKVKPNDKFLEIIKRQRKLFESLIKKYNKTNKIWLDLGCGKANILDYISDFILYMGIDNDNRINLLNKKKFNKKNVVFKTLDLNNDSSYIDIPSLKYDFIIMNHSISHFYNENLIKLLKNNSKKGTIIIFNKVNDKLNKINFDDGYIYRNNDMIHYKFPWVHNTMIKEKFIDENDILNQLSNFKLIEKIENNNSDFESIYTHYILMKD